MATQTTNLNMDIMEPSDTGIIDKMNSNFEKVDAAAGALNESLPFKLGMDENGDYGFYIIDTEGNEVFNPFYQAVGKNVNLYNYGNQCIELTGGWISPKTVSTSKCSNIMDCNGENTGSIKRIVNEDNLYLSATCGSATATMNIASFYTTNRIDLTNYSKIKVLLKPKFTNFATGCNYIKIATKQSNPDGSLVTDVSKYINISDSSDSVIEKVLDISELTSEHWISISVYLYAGDSSTPNIKSRSGECNIYKVWLEK